MNDNTLRDYLRILFRHKLIILTTCVIVTVVAVLGLMLRTPNYVADVKMLVTGSKQVEAPYYKELFAPRENEVGLTQIQIVISNPVLERTVRSLKLYDKPLNYEAQFASPLKALLIKFKSRIFKSRLERATPSEQMMIRFRSAVEELRKNITVEPIKDTNIFIIHVRDYDRLGSAITANTLSRSYMIFDLEQQLVELKLKYGSKHPIVLQLQDNIADMTKNLNGNPLPVSESIGSASVKVIEQATIPLEPTGKSKALLALVAMITGFLMGVILAFIFEFSDQTIKSANEVEDKLQLPVLGNIPLTKKKSSLLANFSNFADQMTLLMANKNVQSVLITASDAHEGASTIAANLGLSMAKHAGKNVVVIDANMHYASLNSIFDVTPEFGLADVLSGSKNTSDVLVAINPKLSYISAGKTVLNPLTLLDSSRMKKLMEELKGRFDLVIIDGPQLNTCRDSLIISPIVDTTVLVVCENKTRRQVVTKVVASLKGINAQLLGVVFNCRTYPIPTFVYERV